MSVLIKALAKGGVGTLARRVTKDKILSAIASSGKSGAVGGVIDGFLGSAEAVKLYRLDYIDAQTAAKHAGNEAACGFFTATAGTLGSTVATLALGSMGPTALVIGMGASVGARWFYRKNSEPVLPDFEAELPLDEEDEKDLEVLMEAIKKMGVDMTEDQLRNASKTERVAQMLGRMTSDDDDGY